MNRPKRGALEAAESGLLKDQASRAGRLLADAAARLRGRSLEGQRGDLRALFRRAIEAASEIETLTG